MKSLNAWVLDLGLGYKVALGVREILHLIDAPTTFDVPCTPPYCSKVVSWQGRMLPVMELASRLDGKSIVGQFIAVVGYQKVRGEYPQFGALLLTNSLQLYIFSGNSHALDSLTKILVGGEVKSSAPNCGYSPRTF